MLTHEELQILDKRIGANADQLIQRLEKTLYSFSSGKAGRKPAFFLNCVRPEMQDVLYAGEEKWPLWVDDIVSGVARLDWYREGTRSVPLSAKNIVKCLAMLERIDSSAISHLLHIEKRQAQRYFKACELLHQKLIDGYCEQGVHSLHYPEVFIYPRQTDLKEDL